MYQLSHLRPKLISIKSLGSLSKSQKNYSLHITHHRDGIHDFLGGEVNALGVSKVRTLELAEHRAVSGGGGLAVSRTRQTRHAAEVDGLRICQRARDRSIVRHVTSCHLVNR